MKKALLMVILGSILLVFVPITIPATLKNKILTNIEEVIGRKVSLGGIKYNLGRNILYLNDFKVYEKDEKNTFIGFNSFEINIDILPLIYKKLNLSDITLRNPNIILLYNEEKANYIDIINNIDNYMKKNSTKSDDNSKSDFFIKEFEINKINIDSFTFRYKDKIVQGTNILTINAPEIYYKNNKLKANLNIDFLKKGNIKLEAKYNDKEKSFDANIKINKLLLDDKLYILKEINDIKTIRGSIDSELELSGNLTSNNYNIKGRFNGDDIKVVSLENEELLRIKKVSININDIEPILNIYDINKVYIEDGYSNTKNIMSYIKLIDKKQDKSNSNKSLNDNLDKKENSKALITNFLKLEVKEVHIKNIELKDENKDLKFNLSGYNIGTHKGISNFILESTLNGEEALNLKMDLDKLKEIKAIEDLKKIKGNIKIKKFPLSMVNYLFKDGVSKLNGYLDIESNIDYTDDYIYTKNKFNINNFSVLEEDLNLKLDSLNSENNIEISQINPGYFNFKGTIKAKKIDYKSIEAKGFLEEVEIDVNKINPTKVDLKLINIKNPTVYINEDIKESSTHKKDKYEKRKSLTIYVYNFLKSLFINHKRTNNSSSTNNNSLNIPITLDIEKINLNNGEFEFKYLKLNLGIKNININSNNFTSQKNKNFDVYIHGELKTGGAVTSKVKGHLKNNWDFQPTSLNAEGKVDIGNLNLHVFKGILEESIPNYLESGKFFYNSTVTLKDSKFKSSNHIELKKLYLGSRTKVNSVIPVKLATQLLKDSNGNIVVEIPIHGDFSNPKFNIYKVLLGQVQSLLLKVTNSPITILKSVFNLKDGEVKRLNYKLLNIEPNDKKDLERITDLLSSSDKLKATFTLSTNKDLEEKQYIKESSKNLKPDTIEKLQISRQEYLKNYFKEKGVLNSISIKLSNKESEKPLTVIEFKF